MRFFHLSDLHIGKQLYGYSLLEDQEWILKQILELVEEQKPDAILIAGDVYDKSVPAAEAVAVLDQFFSALAERNPKIPLLVISGNHDSPERLSFGGQILKKEQVYLAGFPPRVPEEYLQKVTLTDTWGPVDFWMLPYTKPGMIRKLSGEEREEDGRMSYQEALEFLLQREHIDTGHRNVLMAHQFFTAGGKEPKRSDSETVIVGGLDQIDTGCLQDFTYVALGHIHRPQMAGKETIRYCGTPLKYSVSEWNQEKSVTMVDLGSPEEPVKITELPLMPLRDVKILKGKLEEILEAARGEVCEDYVSVILTDETEPYQPKERLEACFSRILEVRMESVRDRGLIGDVDEPAIDMDPGSVFARFFEQMQGRALREEEQEVWEDVLRSIEERE